MNLQNVIVQNYDFSKNLKKVRAGKKNDISAIISVVHNREPESKQMLDPKSRAWKKWQRTGYLAFGRANVNKRRFSGPLYFHNKN